MSYVLNSWCRSSYSHLTSAHYLSKQGPPPPYQLYKVLFDEVQSRIIARSTVTIASNEDDDDQILGFSVHSEGPILYYVQVKKELWRNGIAASLLEAAGIDKRQPCIYTFTSPILAKWKAPGKWKHIPHWMTK